MEKWKVEKQNAEFSLKFMFTFKKADFGNL